MTAVFRAYSPSSGRGTIAVPSRQRAVYTADSLNRLADDQNPADWIVQRGHIEWENP